MQTDADIRQAQRRATFRDALGLRRHEGPTTAPNELDPADVLAFVRALDQAAGRLTSVVSDLLGLSLNSVLVQGRYQLPPSGFLQFSFSAPAAYALVSNDATHTLTVTESPPHAVPLTQGVGVWIVRAAIAKGFPLVGSDCTIYGTAGDSFDLAVYSQPFPPFTGPA